MDPANTIFSIAVDGSSGVVTLSQFAQIDHPIVEDPSATGAPFDDQLATLANGLVNLTATATITDSDGDTATDSQAIDLGGNIRFVDHGPANTEATVTGAVDEDSLANFNALTGFGSNGHLDAVNVGTVATGDLSPLVTAGADSPVSFGLSDSFAGLISQALASKGAALSYSVSGDTLTGFVDLGLGAGYDAGTDRPVFTLQVQSDGGFTFTLLDQIDHLGANMSGAGDDQIKTIDFSSAIVATDYDGDTVTVDNGFTITVEDDVPAVNQVQVLTFDDLLNNGNPFTDGQERGLNTIAPGGYGGFTWAQTGIFNPDPDGNSNPGLAGLGYAVHSETNLAFFGEATGGDAGSEYPGDGGSPIVIQQTDGSNFGFLGAWFSSVNVDGLVVTVTGYDDDNNVVGLDTIAINQGGPIFFDFTGDASNPIDFGSFANIDRLEFDAPSFFGFDNFTFVKNPSYATNNIPVIIVDEDNLAGGIGDTTSLGDDQPLHTSGTLGFLVGADEPAKVDFASMNGQAVVDTSLVPAAVSSGGVALTYFWDASTNTLYASTDVTNATTAATAAAFSIHLTNPATGAYDFALLAAIDHPAPLPAADSAEYKGENNVDIKLVYTVTDADGDSATGNLFVSIDDDTPVASVALDGTPTFVLDETIGGADTPLDDTTIHAVCRLRPGHRRCDRFGAGVYQRRGLWGRRSGHDGLCVDGRQRHRVQRSRFGSPNHPRQ